MTMTTKRSYTNGLLAAVEENNLDLVSWLLEQGADPNEPSKNGWTPLMLAILHDSVEMTESLLKSGTDPNRTTQSEENPCRSPLAVAISNGRLEAVRLLLAYNADADAPDYNGLTAIDLAQKLTSRPFHRDKLSAILFLLKEHEANNLRRPSILSNQPMT